jgi:HSP20 family protein
VWETDEALIVEIDLPGVTRKDMTVEVEGDVLHISGERGITLERKGRHYYQMERLTGRFARQLHLPLNVDRHAIRAKFRVGILTIILPKRHTE